MDRAIRSVGPFTKQSNLQSNVSRKRSLNSTFVPQRETDRFSNFLSLLLIDLTFLKTEPLTRMYGVKTISIGTIIHRRDTPEQYRTFGGS
ncbi:unnamed protein product [Lasius platythorax]|uniref:Uncharacterized protein n=1 Tax=Lasius platythorax TaxID=488582 RepID=A0AAV2NVH2_9HYME